MDLIYSPDDNANYGKGWYWDHRELGTSQLFATAEEARRARMRDELVWDSWPAPTPTSDILPSQERGEDGEWGDYYPRDFDREDAEANAE